MLGITPRPGVAPQCPLFYGMVYWSPDDVVLFCYPQSRAQRVSAIMTVPCARCGRLVTHAGLSLVTSRSALDSHWPVLAGVAALLPGPAFFVRILAAAGLWLPACSARLTSLVGKWRKLTRDWRVWWKLSPDCSCLPLPVTPGSLVTSQMPPPPRSSLGSRSVLILAEIWLNMNKICSGPHQAGITPRARTQHQQTPAIRSQKKDFKQNRDFKPLNTLSRLRS